jgi:hypothetical protein
MDGGSHAENPAAEIPGRNTESMIRQGGISGRNNRIVSCSREFLHTELVLAGAKPAPSSYRLDVGRRCLSPRLDAICCVYKRSSGGSIDRKAGQPVAIRETFRIQTSYLQSALPPGR